MDAIRFQSRMREIAGLRSSDGNHAVGRSHLARSIPRQSSPGATPVKERLEGGKGGDGAVDCICGWCDW